MSVYRQYSQAELDRQYDQRSLVPDLAPYLGRWRSETERARAQLSRAVDLAYGPSPRQRIDLYALPGDELRPVLAFLHGGAWRQLSLEESGFLAPAFTDLGAMVAAVDFDLVPQVSLDEQVAQAMAATRWLLENAKKFGGDPDRLVLCGHSSGAHLAAMILTEGIAVAGAILASGCYDLEPVRLSARNDYLRLDTESARRNSPIQRLHAGLPPTVVCFGDGELEEFQRQGRDFAARREALDGAASLIERAGKNHFDMTLDIADSASPLFKATCALLGVEGGARPAR